jgi:Fe-S-cluster containining protein
MTIKRTLDDLLAAMSTRAVEREEQQTPPGNKEAADRNFNALIAAASVDMTVAGLQDAARRVINQNASRKSKRQKMIALIDEAGAALAPFTPCKKGCSSCCYIPALVFEYEAQVIALDTGRVMQSVARRDPRNVKAETDKYTGVACPFLINDLCSIYDIRPFACRQHHSMDDTAEQCSLDIPSEQSNVPKHAGIAAIESCFVYLGMSESAVIGDLREFFPNLTFDCGHDSL